MITSELIKEQALKLGASDIGIGSLAIFEGEVPQRDPKMILPAATCILGFAFRVPKGLYKAMETGNQLYAYTPLGVKNYDEEFAEIFLFKMAGLIEDDGWDACVQRTYANLRMRGDKSTNPEVADTYELYADAVEPGKPCPDVMIDFGKAAKACGIGERGMSGHVISPKFGPYVRYAFIITDAPLTTDEPLKGSVCDGCKECMTACPGHAIDENGLDTWQCSVYYKGAHRSNPYMRDEFLQGDPNREAILDGEYRFDAKSARALYPKLTFLPDFKGYSACMCGKKCDVACYRHLKEVGKL